MVLVRADQRLDTDDEPVAAGPHGQPRSALVETGFVSGERDDRALGVPAVAVAGEVEAELRVIEPVQVRREGRPLRRRYRGRVHRPCHPRFGGG
jgi:hypothetical protein